MSASLETRHLALLATLVCHDVRFVLVGGVALQVHGYSGVTRDVDVTIAADDANGHRIEAALAAMKAQSYLVGERGSAYRTDYGQLEVMRWTDGVGDYEAWMRDASEVELMPGLTVPVGSASDLLLSKEAAGRDKDNDALPRIRADLLASGELRREDVRGPVAETASEPERDPRLDDLLGPRPTERRTRGLWDHAAELIVGYRERWNIPEDGPLLGAQPPTGDPRAAADRAALDRQLKRLGRMLERDRSASDGLDRDPVDGGEDLERGR